MYSINQEMNKIFKCLGYKTRTDILLEIKKNPECTVSDLAKIFKMNLQTLVFHVKELKNARLILSRKQKGKVFLKYNEKVLKRSFNSLSQHFLSL